MTASTSVQQSTSVASTSAVQAQTLVAKAIPPREPLTSAVAQDATVSKSATPTAKVSTRPKPKRKAKPLPDDVTPDSAETDVASASSTSANPRNTVSTPGLPQSTVGSDALKTAAPVQPLAESTNRNPEAAKKAPVKTYSSKNKDDALVGNNASERSSDNSGENRLTGGGNEQNSRKSASKRRKVVGSDSEFSDTAPPAPARKTSKSTGKDAEQDTAEASVKGERAAKKRAIITSDDETEEEELHTPDSKRRKSDKDARPIPSKTSRPRDSSIDPLDLDMDKGIGGKSERMEVSIEMSPASVIDLQSSLRVPADVEKPTGTKSKTKSPNKVHFVDPPAEGEEAIVKPAPKSKKSKLASRMEDAYDEQPEFAPPVEDEDDEDDFVPNGSKKAKAKAKTAKAKKATAAKEKAGKGKKATQGKGKKGKAAEVAVEPVEVQPPLEEPIVEASEVPVATVEKENSTIDKSTTSSADVSVVIETTSVAAGKGKAKRIVAVGKKSPISAETIQDDDPPSPKARADGVAEKEPSPAPVEDETEAAKDHAPVEATIGTTQGKKAAAKKKVVESDGESEKEEEKEPTSPVVAQRSVVSQDRVLSASPDE